MSVASWSLVGGASLLLLTFFVLRYKVPGFRCARGWKFWANAVCAAAIPILLGWGLGSPLLGLLLGAISAAGSTVWYRKAPGQDDTVELRVLGRTLRL